MTAIVDETSDLHADGMPVVKKTATSSAPPQEAEPAQEPAPKIRPAKDWFSGWCNGGGLKGHKCADGSVTNKVGEPIIKCRYIAENGDKATHLYLFCACACHDGHREPDDPNYVEKS